MDYYNWTRLLSCMMILRAQGLNVNKVEVGMAEDWDWTSETVFKEDKFVKELQQDTEIAGINGSNWATPMAKIYVDNGLIKECYIGSND